jgi:hypothetical protein
VRHEWRSLLIFGGAFSAILLVVVLSVDPAFFYSRLTTDPLLYYQKAVTFATSGHVDARNAINARPFRYVSMPGILRSPFIVTFSEFDNQLRAIQISNIALLAVTATMYAYLLSSVLHPAYRWLAIAFSFGFMLLSPMWLENVFLPMADAPYAAATIGALILTIRIVTTKGSLANLKGEIAAATAFFLIACMVKFTAPLLLLPVAALLVGRQAAVGSSSRRLAFAAVACVLILGVLAVANWDTISHRYLREMLVSWRLSSKSGMVLNVAANALPSQVIPIFDFAFTRHPVTNPYAPFSGATSHDFTVMGVGICLSTIILIGMWRARRMFSPEILYVLAALPVLAILIASTARYLMPYQPFIWIWFVVGAQPLVRRALPALSRHRGLALAVLAVTFAAGIGAVYFRAGRVSGTTANELPGVSLRSARVYTHAVSSEFRDLRTFLESLPKARTLLVTYRPNMGRWKVIAGLDYYDADDTLAVVATRKDAYLLVECGTIELCANFDELDRVMRGWVGGESVFRFDPVFERRSPYARIVVYKLTAHGGVLLRISPDRAGPRLDHGRLAGMGGTMESSPRLMQIPRI